MKKFLFVISLFAMFCGKAQAVFCPPGADWHFAYGGGGMWGPIYYNNEEIKYTHDTTVFGKPAHVLEHTWGYFYNECSPAVYRTYIHTSGDSVWMYNGYTLGAWQMLYNYGTPAGQSWQFSILNFTDSTAQLWNVAVDSVSQTIINANSLKTLHVTYSTTLNMGSPVTYTYNSAIYERMGDTSYLFNFFSDFHGACEGSWAAGLLCYGDSTFGLYQQSARPCNFTFVGIDEINTPHIKIYPNPASDEIRVEMTDKKEVVFLITDMLGNVLRRSKDILKTGDLPNGIYFVNTYSDKGLLSRKIIIQH